MARHRDMTLLIAVTRAERDEELVASSLALGEAACWTVQAVHVHDGGSEPSGDDLEGIELVDLPGDAGDELVALIDQSNVDCVAVGLEPTGPGFGPVAQALLDHFSHPLLLVRSRMRRICTLERILVPLEGTPSSSAAMLFVEEALCERGREIIMINVATGEAPAEVGSLPAPRFVDQEQYEWSDWQDEFSMRFSQRAEGCRHKVTVLVGDPSTIIAAEATARDVELMVLTWKGSFAGARGLVVHRLLETSPCPVLLVPADWITTGREAGQATDERR